MCVALAVLRTSSCIIFELSSILAALFPHTTTAHNNLYIIECLEVCSVRSSLSEV
jgi:hypothetical protein